MAEFELCRKILSTMANQKHYSIVRLEKTASHLLVGTRNETALEQHITMQIQ